MVCYVDGEGEYSGGAFSTVGIVWDRGVGQQQSLEEARKVSPLKQVKAASAQTICRQTKLLLR